MNFLLDTCVISEFSKPRPDPKLIKWINSNNYDQFYLSVISLGEIQKGIAKLDSSTKRDHYTDILHGGIIPQFAERILSLDQNVAITWGTWLGEGKRKKHSFPEIDALIAATAKAFQLTVATRNVSDFKWFDIPIINPWLTS